MVISCDNGFLWIILLRMKTGKAPAVDALLFDLGGVLISIDFGRAMQVWGELSGLPSKLLSARFSFDDAYAAHERGEMSCAGYFAHLREVLGVGLSDEQFRQGWNAIFLDPVPGMADLLKDLSRVLPLYVFSNTNLTHSAYWRPRYRELLAPITEIFCSCELGMRKPVPEAFSRLSGQLGVAAGRLAFFDDLAENVEGARQAGLRAYQVLSSGQVRAILSRDLGVIPG
jgi:glucose-1-phosphatase